MNDVARLDGEGDPRLAGGEPGTVTTQPAGHQPVPAVGKPETLLPTAASLEVARCELVTDSDPTRRVVDAPSGDLIGLGINIAAERLAQGEKVLLLVENVERRDAFMAALARAGIADVGVQVDERTDHSSLLQDIGATLGLHQPRLLRTKEPKELRELLSSRLEHHAQILGTGIRSSGLTPYEALAATLAFPKKGSSKIDLSDVRLKEWEQHKITTAIELARGVDQLFEIGVAPAKNPWRGCAVTGELPASAPTRAAETLKTASLLATEAATLCEAVGLPTDLSEEKLEKVIAALRVIDSVESSGGDALRQVNLKSLRPWTDNREQIHDALRKKRDYARCFRDLGEKVDFFALQSFPIHEATQVASEHHKKSFVGRAIDREYRRMISQLASVCSVPSRVEDVIKVLSHLARLKAIQSKSEEASDVLENVFSDSPLFGATETPADLLTEWRQRSQIASAVFKIVDAVEATQDRTLITLLRRPDVLYSHSCKLHEVGSLLESYKQRRGELWSTIGMDPAEQQSAFTTQPLSSQLKRLQALSVDTASWPHWQRFLDLSEKAKANDLSFIAEYGLSTSPVKDGLAFELERAWYNALADEFYVSRPSVTALDSDRGELVDRMLVADREMRDAYATSVAQKHWDDIPRFACGGEASVLHELVGDPSLCSSADEILHGIPHAFQAAKPLIITTPSAFASLPEGLAADCVILDKGVTISADHPLSAKEHKPEILQLSDELPAVPQGVSLSAPESGSVGKSSSCPAVETASFQPNTIDRFSTHLRTILEKDLGLSVQANVVTPRGVVDLAVIDPSKPGHYKVCIFPDGLRYQSAPSILEEERSRDAIAYELSSRPPQREWVLEWYENPSAQKRRFIADIQEALQSQGEVGESASVRIIERQPLPPERAGIFVPYNTAMLDANTARLLQRNKGQVDTLLMADVIANIVRQEGPIHRDELVARFAQLSGLRSVSDQQLLGIIEGTQLALRNGQVVIRQDCAYSSDKTQTIYPRMRGNLPGTLARFERIPPDELEAAICTLVKKAHGISKEELPKELYTAFGYKAPPFAGDNLLQRTLKELLKKQVLIESAGRLFLEK